MTWKRAFVASAILLIVSNVAWLYDSLDHGVTDMYAEVASREAQADLDVLKRLLPETAPLTRKDVLTLLRRTNPDAFIVDDSSGVSVGGLRFEFEEERLARVEDYDQPPSGVR